jgi:hypothetical protein
MAHIPYMSNDAAEIVGKLALGQFCIFMHEWADLDEITPQEWCERVAAACELDGVPCEFDIRPRASLTVVANPSRPPTLDQIETAVQGMVRARWRQKGLPSEVVALTGSEDPHAADRARNQHHR